MINVIAQFKTILATGISKTATSGVLDSNSSSDNDGATIPNGDYGIVIDERNSSREYAVITVNGFNFTFVKRGLSVIDGSTEKDSNKFDHRKGAEVKIVSHPIITLMARVFNGQESFGGVPTLPASRVISNQRDVIDKEYADSLVLSNVPTLAVVDAGGLDVTINSGYYLLNGALTYYAGASETLTDDNINYIQLKDNALDLNLVGFDHDAMPLAKVTTVSGDITALEDARAMLSWLDIKANYGLARDTTGIFIDLAATPGLEFSGGKLTAKIKAAGGITKDADGLSVTQSVIREMMFPRTETSAIAAETLAVGDLYRIPTSATPGSISTTSNGSGTGWDWDSWGSWVAIPIDIVTGSKTFISHSISIGTVNTGGTITAKIVKLAGTWDNGNPTASLAGATTLATSSQVISSTGTKTFTFSTPPKLYFEQFNYALIYEVGGSYSNMQFGNLRYTDPQGHGYKYFNSGDGGSSWSADSYYPGSFSFTGDDQIIGDAYLASTTQADGVVISAADPSEEVDLQTSGLAAVPGAVAGKTYFSAGSGNITDVADGTKLSIGLGIEADTILIMKGLK